MSSTKRGNNRDYHISDYYATPVPVIVGMLRELDRIDPNIIRAGSLTLAREAA